MSGVERLLGPSHKTGKGVDLKVETKYFSDVENAVELKQAVKQVTAATLATASVSPATAALAAAAVAAAAAAFFC